jgi:hypothetical protein
VFTEGLSLWKYKRTAGITHWISTGTSFFFILPGYIYWPSSNATSPRLTSMGTFLYTISSVFNENLHLKIRTSTHKQTTSYAEKVNNIQIEKVIKQWAYEQKEHQSHYWLFPHLKMNLFLYRIYGNEINEMKWKLQYKFQLEEYKLDCFGQVDDAPNRGARIILWNFKIKIKLESEWNLSRQISIECTSSKLNMKHHTYTWCK